MNNKLNLSLRYGNRKQTIVRYFQNRNMQQIKFNIRGNIEILIKKKHLILIYNYSLKL